MHCANVPIFKARISFFMRRGSTLQNRGHDKIAAVSLRSGQKKWPEIELYSAPIDSETPIVSCKNHPNVEAIDNCARCDAPLCGMCANFTDTGIFCETCERIHETEQLVAARTRELDPQFDQILGEAITPENPELETSGKSRHKGERVFLLGGGFVTLALYVGMFIYSHPNFLEGSEEQARRIAAQAFEDCVYTFQAIGEILEEGDMPDPSLRCDESTVPNVITRDGDTIRIAHPNPTIHGYSQIFATNISHEPTLIE